MKCKNIVTGHVFEIGIDEGKKLLEEFDCFEIVNPTVDEQSVLSQTKKKNLSIRQRVMKSKRKE